MLGLALFLLGLSSPQAELLDRAREALDSRRPEEVIRLVGSYLASEAASSDELSSLSASRDELRAAFLLRGAAYQMLGATTKAAEDFGRAVEIDPGDVAARMSLGRIRLREARLPEAREQFAAVTARDSEHAEAQHLLGVVHLDLSREPGAPRENELFEARRALEKALELNPRHPPTVAILTVVLDELGLFSDSERVFEAGLDGLERDAALIQELALIYSRLTNYDRSAKVFERLPAEGTEAAYRAFQLGNCYRETRRHEKAKRYLQQAVVLDPENGAARLLLGSVLFRMGEIDEARAALERALQDGDVGAQAHIELARLLGSRGELAAALEHCREAIALRPELAEAYYELGQLLAQAGSVEEASRAFERFEVLKKVSEEIQRYAGRISHYTDDVMSYLELAHLYREQGRADRAAEALQRAGRIDPDLIAIPLAMADLLIEQGLYAEASTFSQQVLAREPQNREALWQVSSIHLAQYDPIEAERSLRLLLDLDPGHARAWNDLGVILERGGRYPEAIAAFERAIASDPQFALPHNGLGVAFFETGDYAQSAEHFEKMVDLAPSYAQARFNLAEAYRRLGRDAEAEAQMREYERLR